MKEKFALIYFLLAAAAVGLILPTVALSQANAADTSLTVVGDVGCKSASKSNLNNIAKETDTKFLGLGDYLYSCSKTDIQKNWDNIKQEKHGVYGNHDVEKAASKQWAKDNLGLGENGWFSWKIGDVAIIGINNYKPFIEGSAQHAYLERKTTQFCGREDSTLNPINWVIYATHEPTQTPNVGGGHAPNKPLRNVLESLTEACGSNVLILEAHNHITAFGNVQGNNHALCGGGGFGGDNTGDSDGFEFQTKQFGYCKIDFNSENATVQLIGTDGNEIKGASHIFTK